MTEHRERTELLYREWFPRTVGAVARRFGDLDLAEECAQEAFATALERWPVGGTPADPGAWLIRTAHNRAVDRLRRTRVAGDRERDAAVVADWSTPEDVSPVGHDISDDRLRLAFACGHPALSSESRLMLTLRLVAGLTVPEIARALLVDEAAVAQRIVRAKRRIRAAAIPIEAPPRDRLAERLGTVLSVCYLVFNEGHSTTAGDAPTRTSLAAEAVRLVRLLARLLPDETEPRALLALLLLHDARRRARFDPEGRIVPLDCHDRSRYDRDRIEEGLALLDELTAAGASGTYALQAAIAAEHSIAPSFEATDWRAIVAYYDALLAREGSPVVALNRAVAVGMRDGPESALAIVEELAGDGRLDGYAPLYATRADLLRRMGRLEAAARAYGDALCLTRNVAERAFLDARRRTCVAGAVDDDASG